MQKLGLIPPGGGTDYKIVRKNNNIYNTGYTTIIYHLYSLNPVISMKGS